MITADTITDEQIRELRAEASATIPQGSGDVVSMAPDFVVRICNRALGGIGDARARCAEILNARAKDGAK